MASRVLKGQVIATDETRAPVLEPGSGKVQTGHMWVYYGQQGVCPYTIYDYTRTKEGIGPRMFLQGYEGYLQADAARIFDNLYHSGKVLEVACGAHMRRYFHEAKPTAPMHAHVGLTICSFVHHSVSVVAT
jgi:transposase